MGPTLRTLAILAGLGAVASAIRGAGALLLFAFFAVALCALALGAWWDMFDARTSADEQPRPVDAPPPDSDYWR